MITAPHDTSSYFSVVICLFFISSLSLLCSFVSSIARSVFQAASLSHQPLFTPLVLFRRSGRVLIPSEPVTSCSIWTLICVIVSRLEKQDVTAEKNTHTNCVCVFTQSGHHRLMHDGKEVQSVAGSSFTFGKMPT